MDAQNREMYAIIMSEEKKTLESEVEELVRREEAEEARQKAAEKAEEAARQASINESKKLIQILDTNVMTKELQKMKIDKRNDSCSKCDYGFKQENIANIENIDPYEDIDFSEEIDEYSVFKELDGETEHISAIFDAMHDKQAQKNTVKVEIIEDKSENIILSDNKSDE